MAVYNEEPTVKKVVDAVLHADLPGDMGLQLIIVESNSTDETRAIVSSYDDPRIALILQDVARGKGNAVRQGLTQVTGQVVLIQDGDLEYSVEDYPDLLAPIIAGETDFVLGSRHAKGVPMRDFADARLVSRIMNAGHWIFTSLFNVFFGTRLRDPFTMYKVFRTECITGLNFVSNRFDFDYELVAKLVRRGYVPVEVPVTYRSRGYADGKKVRLIRDPLSWIVALFRFRFTSLEGTSTSRDTETDTG
jgi:glycosyltransferase involved in cell wall biosynthesis